MRKHYPLNSAGAEDAGQLPWTDGVPSTGVEGSYPGHAIVTDVEAEVLGTIDAAGLVRSGTDLTQLMQAVSRGIYLGGFTGSANALAGTIPNSVIFPTLLPGMRFTGIASITNTGPATVTLAGFAAAPGVLSLLRRDGTAVQAGDIPVGAPFDIQFDGSAFRFSVPTKSEIANTIADVALVHFGRDTGTVANTLTVATITPSVTAFADGMLFEVVPNTTNSGGCQIALGASSSRPLLRRDGAALQAGDIVNGAPFLCLVLGNVALVLNAVRSEIAVTAVTVINGLKIPGGTPFQFATPGAYTLNVDKDVTFAVRECRGAGGGGGGATGLNAAGSGGGGGGNSQGVFTATTASVLTITVGAGGAGGAGGASPGDGTAGGTTSVVLQSGSVVGATGTAYAAGQTLSAATGGGYGYVGNGSSQGVNFGMGGVGAGGDLNDRGDSGGFPVGLISGAYLGGSGGASPGSGGSPGPNLGAGGNSSSAPGVGGNGSSNNAAGGNGAPGRVTITK